MTGEAGAREAQARRLFVGLMPQPGEDERLAAAVSRLRHGGRPVPAGNLHLTLAFLGHLAPGPGEAAAEALGAVEAPAFRLELATVGHFPRARVLWCAAVPAPGALYRLQGRVAHALSQAGVTLESRPFTPHVTVARKVARYRGPGALGAPVRWTLREFRLVASQTLPQGARYETVRAWGLHE